MPGMDAQLVIFFFFFNVFNYSTPSKDPYFVLGGDGWEVGVRSNSSDLNAC